MLEQAIVFIDNISLKRSITGKIIDILLRTGLDIVGMKMIVPDKIFIKDYCRIVKSKLSRNYVSSSYPNKRILAIALQGENAVEKIKYITGRERKQMNKEYWHGTTIRGIYFGGSRIISLFFKVYENVVQIADTKQESERLIKLTWKKHKMNGYSIKHLKGHEMRPNEERTLIMLKPATVEYRLAGKVIDDLSKSGLYIVGANIVRPTLEQLKQHYIGLIQSKGMATYKEVIEHFAGIEKGKKVKDTKFIQLVYRGPSGEVTKVIREIIGATKPENAGIGTIRRSFGKDITENVVHASATPEDTEKELAIWDTPNELIEQIIEYKPKIFEI
jgi:nucleoside-diphosphate kinase